MKIIVSGAMNVKDVTPKNVDLITFLTSDKYKEAVMKVRGGYASKVDVLPICTPSALCEGSFSDDAVIEHTGLLCIDVDGKDNIYSAEHIKSLVKGYSNVFYAGLSASGKGVAILIKIPKNKHREAFEMLKVWFKELEIVIDPQCGNIARKRFYSYDPDYYLNEHATELNVIEIEQPKPKAMQPIVSNNVERDGRFNLSMYAEKVYQETGSRDRMVYATAKAALQEGLSQSEIEQHFSYLIGDNKDGDVFTQYQLIKCVKQANK